MPQQLKNKRREKKEPKDYDRLVVYVPKEKTHHLKAQLAFEGKTMSWFFREKIEEYLEYKRQGKL